MQLGRYYLYQNFRLKTDPEKESAVVDQLSAISYQPYALKSGGGFARLTDDYAQRQP